MKRTLILLLALLVYSAAWAAPFTPVSVVETHDLSIGEPATLMAKAWLEDYRALINAASNGEGYSLREPMRNLIARLDTLAAARTGFFRPPDDGTWLLAGHGLELLKVDTPEIAPRADVARGVLAPDAAVGDLEVAADRLMWLPVGILRDALVRAMDSLGSTTADNAHTKAILTEAFAQVHHELRYRDAALLSAYGTLEDAIQYAPAEPERLRTRLRDAAVALHGEASLQSFAEDLEALAQQAKSSDYPLVATAAKFRTAIEARARAAVEAKSK